MVHSRYNSLRVSRNASVRPPERTARRVPFSRRGESVELSAEEMDPEVPVRGDP
jgi:hypothetical protein